MTADTTVTDEQLGQYLRRESDLRRRLREGSIDLNRTMQGMQSLIEGRAPIQIPDGMKPEEVTGLLDAIQKGFVPLEVLAETHERYTNYRLRMLESLMVIGPKELDSVFRPEGNPIHLPENWIPDDIPPVPEEYADFLLNKWQFDERFNQSRAVLALMPPEVAGIPVTFDNLYNWFGVPHDGREGGIIRQDILLSNWYLDRGDCPWAREPIVSEWRWHLFWDFLPATVNLNWKQQQKLANDWDIDIATPLQDAYVIILVKAATDINLRSATRSRTKTIYAGCPLDVGASSDGVYVSRRWGPEGSRSGLGLSVHGVPKKPLGS